MRTEIFSSGVFGLHVRDIAHLRALTAGAGTLANGAGKAECLLALCETHSDWPTSFKMEFDSQIKK